VEKQVVFYSICRACGLLALGRALMRRSPHLIIINYHRAEGHLRKQLLYIRKHYRVMHLEEALEEFFAPEGQKKAVRDRRTPVVLTFDDGYRSCYTHALPLARELQVPLSIFLVPEYVGSEKRFWWLEGTELVEHAQASELTLGERCYRLSNAADRQALAEEIYRRTCYAHSVAERETFLAEMREKLAVPPEHQQDATCILNWEEIREMQESGWFSFGAHTMYHPVLAELSDPAEVEYEVRECRKVLQERLGLPVRVFAYPLGRMIDIGEYAVAAVEKAGYDWALTTIWAANTPQSQPLLLARQQYNANWHWLLIAAGMAGLSPFFDKIFPYGRIVLGLGSKVKASFSRLFSPAVRGRVEVKNT